MSSKMWIAGGIGIVGAVLFGLYLNNISKEGKQNKLEKSVLTRLLKLIRAKNFILYKQVTMVVHQLAQQFRNNLTPEMIQQYLSSPESHINIQKELDNAMQSVCQSQGVSVDDFTYSIEAYKDDQEINRLIQHGKSDYQEALKGKTPKFQIKIPAQLTKQRIYEIQNRLTKKTYIFQVEVFKLMKKYSTQELNSNPSIFKDLGNPEEESNKILEEQNIGSQFEPPIYVYQQAIQNYRKDIAFNNKMKTIEQGYAKLLMKYSPKMQNQSITEEQLQEMEDEIIFYNPL